MNSLYGAPYHKSKLRPRCCSITHMRPITSLKLFANLRWSRQTCGCCWNELLVAASDQQFQDLTCTNEQSHRCYLWFLITHYVHPRNWNVRFSFLSSFFVILYMQNIKLYALHQIYNAIWKACDDFMCLQFDRLSSAPILSWPVITADLFTKLNIAIIINCGGNKRRNTGNVVPLAFFFIYTAD